MSNIVSLSDIKTYMSITSSDYDDLLNMMNDQATSMIEAELGTVINATNITNEAHNGEGFYDLVLNNYPLIEVTRLSQGIEDVITVRYGDDTVPATVQVNSSSVVLKDAAGGQWNTHTLTRSDFTTISDVGVRINAVSGWSAVVAENYEYFPAEDIVNTPALNVRNSYAYIKIPEDSGWDYQIKSEKNAILYNAFGWGKGIRDIYINYRAGYETVPNGLKSAALELVKYLYNSVSADMAYETEKIGDYSYKHASYAGNIFGDSISKTIPTTINVKLNPYRRIFAF